MGALVGQKGTKHQSRGAAESSVTAPKETGRAGQGQGEQPHQVLAGQELRGQPPPPGLLGHQGWL